LSSQSKRKTQGKNLVVDMDETNDGYIVRFPKPSLRYIDFFLKLEFASQLVATGFYPSAKEISETMGVFEAVRRGLELSYSQKDIAVVVIGDGHCPRTATYFVHMTEWMVYSIDPALIRDWEVLLSKTAHLDRLRMLPQMIEECALEVADFSTVVLVFVHSHASLAHSLQALSLNKETRVHAVSMPCCQDDDLGIDPDFTIHDPAILTVMRAIHVYKDIHNSII